MDGKGNDTLGSILDEVEEVFRFVQGERPQDRAHDYLRRHEVCRGFDDTAMQCAAADMVRRAYAAGLAEGSSGSPGTVDRAAAAMSELAGRLLSAAVELRGIGGDDR